MNFLALALAELPFNPGSSSRLQILCCLGEYFWHPPCSFTFVRQPVSGNTPFLQNTGGNYSPKQFFLTPLSFELVVVVPSLWMSSNTRLPARITHCLHFWQVKGERKRKKKGPTSRHASKRNQIKPLPAPSPWALLSMGRLPSGRLILPFPIFMLCWHSSPSISESCIGWLCFLIVLLTLISSTYSGPCFMARCKLFISWSTPPSHPAPPSWISLDNS